MSSRFRTGKKNSEEKKKYSRENNSEGKATCCNFQSKWYRVLRKKREWGKKNKCITKDDTCDQIIKSLKT